MWRLGMGTTCLVALVVTWTMACGSSSAASAATRPSHTVNPPRARSPQLGPAALARWQALGATEAPPASVLEVSLGGASVVNHTAGLVSDDQSDAWAEDFVRTFNYLLWAVSHGQDQFLYRSGLSSAPFTVFQPNVYDIQQARAAGSQVVYTRQTFRRFVIRSVPSSMQSTVQRAGYVWSPYAIYLDAVGPVETDWIDAHGNKTVKSQFQAGAPVFELVGGEPKHDPVLGDVWMMSFDFDCTATSSRQGLAPLCDQ